MFKHQIQTLNQKTNIVLGILCFDGPMKNTARLTHYKAAPPEGNNRKPLRTHLSNCMVLISLLPLPIDDS